MIVFLTVVFAMSAGAVGLFLLSLTAERPTNLGVHSGRLTACPETPNCVSSQSEDREHWIAPISVPASNVSAIEVLAEIVRSMPRTMVVEQTNDYLRVEFRSRIFRFCDDVEFLFEPQSSRVHVRSASRVGHSDLGVNRERIELIRRKFEAATRPAAARITPKNSTTTNGNKNLARI